MNMALNGLSTEKHSVVQSDCVEWLKECKAIFDVIFVDPPTFSNTKKEKRVFDIQRDHFDLITLAMSRLAESGVLFFSTNYKRFVLDVRLGEFFDIKNISQATIPYDFSRSRKIHMCWEMTKKKVGDTREGDESDKN